MPVFVKVRVRVDDAHLSVMVDHLTVGETLPLLLVTLPILLVIVLEAFTILLLLTFAINGFLRLITFLSRLLLFTILSCGLFIWIDLRCMLNVFLDLVLLPLFIQFSNLQ